MAIKKNNRFLWGLNSENHTRDQECFLGNFYNCKKEKFLECCIRSSCFHKTIRQHIQKGNQNNRSEYSKHYMRNWRKKAERGINNV